MTQWRTPKLKKLARALLAAPDEATMLNFLRDLCSLEELEDLSTRWKIAELLEAGHTYRDIAKKVGVSTTTVTRTAQSLNHGTGGLAEMLEYDI